MLRILLFGAVAVAVFLPATAAQADPSPEQIEQELEKAHGEVEDIVEDFNRIGEELKATQASAATLNEKLAPLLAKLDSAQSGVTTIATSAYKTGGGLATAGHLLNSGSATALVHQVESMDRIARSRQREIASYTTTKEQYEKEKKRLDDLIAAQTQQQKQLNERRTKIDAEIARLEQLERRLTGGRPVQTGTGAKPPPPPSGSGKGAVAVRYAYAQLGKMYRYGAAGPSNFDCSGLTQQAWRAAGVSLPHNAAMQYRSTAKVSRASLVPGDLVYYRGLGHVGIYIGNGQIIDAYRTGRPVELRKLDLAGMSIVGYTRPG